MPKGRTRIEAFATLMCITNRDDPQGAQAVPAAPAGQADRQAGSRQWQQETVFQRAKIRGTTADPSRS